jgi:long-chain acyl-CoA synthetase
VVTERERKLVALVYPDFEALKAENIAEDAVPKIMEDNRVKVNAELPKYEQISKIELVKEEFEKTPKKNIKRFKYV